MIGANNIQMKSIIAISKIIDGLSIADFSRKAVISGQQASLLAKWLNEREIIKLKRDSRYRKMYITTDGVEFFKACKTIAAILK